MNRTNALQTINVNGERLKVRIFNFGERLYRANSATFVVNGLASNNYKGAPIKYFALTNADVKSYIGRSKPITKTWEAIEDLVLIDILDMPTRQALARLIGDVSLNVSFPIRNNTVYRVSEEDEVHHDNAVLRGNMQSSCWF